MVAGRDRFATPWAASTETVTATRPLLLIDAASDPPLAWEGATKVDAVMNCLALMVAAATLPRRRLVSVTASGGMLPRRTLAVVIIPLLTALSPVVPFGMLCEATNASATDVFCCARVSADDT